MQQVGEMSILDEYEAGGDISGLVEVGVMEEVGRLTAQGASPAAIVAAVQRGAQQRAAIMRPHPSPPFGREAWNIQRRAPAGFQTAAGVFSATVLAAGQQILSCQVQRPTQIDRLLIVPSAPGLIIQSFTIGDVEQLLTPGVPVELYGVQSLTDSVPDNFSPLASNARCALTLFNTTGATITATLGFKANTLR